MVITAIVKIEDYLYDEVFLYGASMGYYEYSILEGKYLFILKYIAKDNEYRIA